MINRQAADFVGFHCHSPAQWATMLVLVRRGTRRLTFCDAIERDYFSFHFDDVSQPCTDFSGQDGSHAITSEEQRECQAWGENFQSNGADIAARVLNVRHLAGWPGIESATLGTHCSRSCYGSMKRRARSRAWLTVRGRKMRQPCRVYVRAEVTLLFRYRPSDSLLMTWFAAVARRGRLDCVWLWHRQYTDTIAG